MWPRRQSLLEPGRRARDRFERVTLRGVIEQMDGVTAGGRADVDRSLVRVAQVAKEAQLDVEVTDSPREEPPVPRCGQDRLEPIAREGFERRDVCRTRGRRKG